MFSFTSIEQFHASIKEGKTSCTEAVQYFLDAIAGTRHLNAFAEVYHNEALERASFLDKQQVHGKLHGVVVGIKDNICYKGHTAQAASKMLEGHRSLYSATAVERILNEGAIIIGRQNCDEFGMGSTNENSVYGPVPNPVDHNRVAGGSSGGSAAAVKAGLCMVALGSDTGGSVRLPADFCGVVGYKPAYGRISRYGLISYASSFDQIGIIANNVKDVSAVLSVMAGADAYDSTALHQSLNWNEPLKDRNRIAWFPEWLEHPSMDPEIAKAIHSMLYELKEQGHEVEAVHFPFTEYIVPAYYILTTAEASSNLARYDGARFGYRSAKISHSIQEFYQNNRTEGFGKEVKRRILLGTYVLSAGYFDAYYKKAQQVRMQLKKETENIFSSFDFIIAPNSPAVAYHMGSVNHDPVAMYMGDIFTVFANLSGIPAISLPVFKHSSKIPFGLSVHSSPHNEVSLQRFSHQLMQQQKQQ